MRLLLKGTTRAALLAAAIFMPGCGTTIADLPSPIGLPADAPARPQTPLVYPAVHDMPPARSTAVLTEAEQKQIEQDLATARDRQRAKAGVKPKPKQKPGPKPRPATARAEPAGSNPKP